jgi:EmrB/QacA subfamily drug resistance transporter
MTTPPATAMPAEAEKTHADRGITLLFCGLMVTMLLSSLNQTVLSSALPTIVGELHGVTQMTWVITAFILASTIMMPVYGKLGDMLGRKPLLIGAIVIFMAGSVLGGLATSISWLIVARVVQGVGGGGLMILSQATIADVIPARERGKYMGIMGGVFAFSSVAGPLLGGWFTEGPGWRWVFWINIPLGLLAVAAAVMFLKAPRRAQQARPVLDYLGMSLMAIATTAIVLVGTWGGSRYEWGSLEIIGLAIVAVVAGVLFVAVESKADEPVIPLSLFKDRNFNLTTVAALATGVAMFGAIGYMPTYLQMAKGATATQAGFLMIPMMGALLITSVVTGQVVSRTGRYKVLPIAGSVVVGVGLALMSTIQVDTATELICTYLAVLGVGLGSSMQILTLVVQNSFPLRQVGTATAANNYFRQVGATLGSAVVGSVFASRLSSLLLECFPQGMGNVSDSSSLTPSVVSGLPDQVRLPIIESYNEALIPIFLIMVPLVLIAAIALCFIDEKPLATTIDDEVLEQAFPSLEGKLGHELALDGNGGESADAMVGGRGQTPWSGEGS